MNIDRFWQTIEIVWQSNTDAKTARDTIIGDDIEYDEQSREWQVVLAFINNQFEEKYIYVLSSLSKQELTDFIHLLEKTMYHIDRQEIHDYLDGSDDGFLYARCFVVSMGQAYYNLIDSNPSKGEMNLEFEAFGFVPYNVYEEKFSEDFERYQYHSMESVSNDQYWD